MADEIAIDPVQPQIDEVEAWFAGAQAVIGNADYVAFPDCAARLVKLTIGNGKQFAVAQAARHRLGKGAYRRGSDCAYCERSLDKIASVHIQCLP